METLGSDGEGLLSGLRDYVADTSWFTYKLIFVTLLVFTLIILAVILGLCYIVSRWFSGQTITTQGVTVNMLRKSGDTFRRLCQRAAP